jgi:hypothetical protein
MPLPAHNNDQTTTTEARCRLIREEYLMKGKTCQAGHAVDVESEVNACNELCRARTSSARRILFVCRSTSLGSGLADYPRPVFGNTVGHQHRPRRRPGQIPTCDPLSRQSYDEKHQLHSPPRDRDFRRPSGDGASTAATTTNRAKTDPE